jgi:hypothetical protein
MLPIFAEALPQPVSEPVHYTALDYLTAFLVFAIAVVVLIAVLAAKDKRMAQPQIILIALLLMMFCSPLSIAYLVFTYQSLEKKT